MRVKVGLLGAVLLAVCLAVSPVHAGWLDFLTGKKDKQEEDSVKKKEAKEQTPAKITENDQKGAVKDALFVAAQNAVKKLGQKDGFLKNELVKIAVPKKLQSAEKLLRKFGQDKLVDQFEESMNRAAEKAVPETVDIFSDAVKEMTVTEAAGLITGKQDAATQYFEDKTRGKLEEKISPIVKTATAEAKVTHYYKEMMGTMEKRAPFASAVSVDLDDYVTQKAVDGLFAVMREEEKKIRENPAARTTDLLKKVFSSLTE